MPTITSTCDDLMHAAAAAAMKDVRFSYGLAWSIKHSLHVLLPSAIASQVISVNPF